MANDQGNTRTHPQLILATAEQAPVLANLLELYIHDFSDFHALELKPDGRFSYPDLPLYWQQTDRHAFLIKVEGNLAGFVLVKRGSDLCADKTAWDVAEFFIVRRYRRRGIGSEIAQQVWKEFPGNWQVRVREKHASALLFWEHALARFTGKAIHSVPIGGGAERWRLFCFHSPKG